MRYFQSPYTRQLYRRRHLAGEYFSSDLTYAICPVEGEHQKPTLFPLESQLWSDATESGWVQSRIHDHKHMHMIKQLIKQLIKLVKRCIEAAQTSHIRNRRLVACPKLTKPQIYEDTWHGILMNFFYV
jgi:hypothetical protein